MIIPFKYDSVFYEVMFNYFDNSFFKALWIYFWASINKLMSLNKLLWNEIKLPEKIPNNSIGWKLMFLCNKDFWLIIRGVSLTLNKTFFVLMSQNIELVKKGMDGLTIFPVRHGTSFLLTEIQTNQFQCYLWLFISK